MSGDRGAPARPDAAAQTAEVRDTWDRVAPGWDRYEPQLAERTGPVRRRLLELVDARPGETVLELAAGTGALSRTIASVVGPAGAVLCTDLSPRMVEVARRRADEAGLANVRCQVADAQRLDLPPGSADAIVCSFGLMLVPDVAAALRGARRVLRPGGRLVLSTWGAPERNTWILAIGGALLHHGRVAVADPTGPGGIFSLSDPNVVEAELRSAGSTDVAVELLDVEQRFASFDEYWELQVAIGGPIATALAGLDEDEVAQVQATCRAFSAAAASGDGYAFPGQAVLARAS